ncbi:MAG: 16S rRNA (adenine(1518)-N(6)/adenine(1519)-N(6))-dimethyltransferase RsmA [Spirochaetaceae bacterium]|nr:16S rRNA (adenine(1518)-N(6)/adenine(1519)-N(6))-dimethyltransferase RsmA [Spirochaetaceae bacterium]
MIPSLNYDSPRELRRFLESRNLGMRKMYGQNFLINGNARKNLLDALETGQGDAVWEIGPGIGAMTTGLLERGALVTAFEIDRGFCAVLKEFFGGCPGFKLIEGDALKTWPESRDAGDYLFGNLPYNTGAALLADFIEKKRYFKRMVVTVQKEVARRMAAKPGSKDYSSFSLLCASSYRVGLLSALKGASFYPEPRVDSQGVRLDLIPGVENASYPACFFPLVRCLFSSRRKTVMNNLKTFIAGVLPPSREGEGRAAAGLSARGIAGEALALAGIKGGERAECLGVEELSALATAVEKLTQTENPYGS